MNDMETKNEHLFDLAVDYKLVFFLSFKVQN